MLHATLRRVLPALLVLLLAAPPAVAGKLVVLSGTVRRVADGDSYFIDVGKPRWIEVRVAGIDCPEEAWPGRWTEQPFAPEAKAFASRELLGKPVRLEIRSTDAYGRRIGEVFVADRPMSRQLVGAGLAWWYQRYAPHDHALEQLQAEAQAAHRGLWSQPSPQPPWVHRHH